MFLLSVLQMWLNGYLVLWIALCNSSCLFTWEPKHGGLTDQERGRDEMEPCLIHPDCSQSKPRVAHPCNSIYGKLPLAQLQPALSWSGMTAPTGWF